MAYYLGVDVGGSHITLNLVDSETFAILEGTSLRKPLNTHVEPTKVLEVFDQAIREIADAVGRDNILGVGLAFPGPFNYPEGICRITPQQNKYEQLFGVNFRQYLCHALGADKPVVFNNDAACFALGEYFNGGAKGYKRAVVVTLGTGFGASFIRDGRTQTTGDDVPKDGELWHIPYQDGIADDYFSTRWLVKEWKLATGEDVPGGKEVADAAEAGNPAALEIYRRYGANLAECVAPWLELFQTEAFVIGGNLAMGWDLFIPTFEVELAKRITRTIAIKKCEMGEQASVCGAALSQTLVNPAEIIPGTADNATIAKATEAMIAIGDAATALCDGPETFPWREWRMALDSAFRAQGKRVVWFDAAAARENGLFKQDLLADIRADATAALCIAYGPGAAQVPWADAAKVTL